MAKSTHYVVWKGRSPGIYSSWPDCQEQTKGFKGAHFKGFPSLDEAEAAFLQQGGPAEGDGYIENSISVDVGCSGNPGVMEYRCACTKTGTILFHRGPYPVGTNNIGEFLGVVDGLRYLKEKGEDIPVYTDSRTAMAWVRDRKVKTTLPRNSETEELLRVVDEALKWLSEQKQPLNVLKWETGLWGEIKADFGRK